MQFRQASQRDDITAVLECAPRQDGQPMFGGE
jgi:hypothetical protein